MSQYSEEIEGRRTFTIISHPNASKATLIEKLLLLGGTVHAARTVKSNKIKKTATSNWTEIEKQHDISVAVSTMASDYFDHKINVLDTPGHQDLIEGTFRTLTVVDSAIIMIDITKGVEVQTRKLMEAYRMRKTPVIVSINKMDRDDKDPSDLLDEIEEELRIEAYPLSWPVDMRQRFWGVYNIFEQKLNLYTPNKQYVTENVELEDITSPDLGIYIDPIQATKLREDIELIEGVYPGFNVNMYSGGDIAPIFFGSTLNNLGVKELLDCFICIAPSSRPIYAVERVVDPNEDNFTGFIFKIRANMDPNHRSYIVFVRVCSGRFEHSANYKYIHFGKMMRFSSSMAFMAQRKEVVGEAFAGDIIGLSNTGNFKIGGALTSGEGLHFKRLPSFSSEVSRYIENADPMKAKQLNKGIKQLMDGGVAQLFTNQSNGRKIIGTMG